VTTVAMTATESSGGRFSKRCGVCARLYEASAWSALPVVATLPPASVQTHLSVSAGWAIELRTCECGAVLAARC
jgi:hypothetical protein